jgi:hypothetical protein
MGSIEANPNHFSWSQRTAIFKPTNPLEPVFLAGHIWILVRNRGHATIRIGTEEGVICRILMKNGSAALSLLNKVCDSI